MSSHPDFKRENSGKTESQRAYVSSKVREKLKLKTLRTEKIIIKTFGNDDSKLQTLQSWTLIM